MLAAIIGTNFGIWQNSIAAGVFMFTVALGALEETSRRRQI